MNEQIPKSLISILNDHYKLSNYIMQEFDLLKKNSIIIL